MVRAASRRAAGVGRARGVRTRKGHVPWVLPGIGGDGSAQATPPVGLTSLTLRFCSLIQAVVTNPDSTVPTEEAEGVGEVLEVRKGAGRAGRRKGPGPC